MKKKRMTRNSFKRKVILFGIMAFMSIALVATGFAAWVIAGDATENTAGNVTIGTVTDKSLDITLNSTSADIAFECDQNDTHGRIRKSGEEVEKLSFVVSGEITDASFLDTLSVVITLPESVKNAVGDDSNPKYITIPKEVNELLEISTTDFEGGKDGYHVVDNVDGTKTAYFQFTVKFGWGEFFGGVNPGYWYDGVTGATDEVHEDQSGAGKSTEKVMEEMETFRNSVYVPATEPGGLPTPPAIDVKVVATAG